METALIPRLTVTEICKQRNEAINRMQEAIVAMRLGNDIATTALKHAELAYGSACFVLEDRSKQDAYKRLFLELDPDKSLESFRQQVDARCWMNMMVLSGMDAMMDKTAKDELYKSLLTNVPECTEDNVYATLAGLRRDAALIFQRGLARAFTDLDRRFRSHDGFKIGGRMILSHAFDEWGSWNWRTRMRDTIADIERVFAVLDNNQPDPKGLIDAINASRGKGFEPRQSLTEGAYFRIRGFMNGNAHLWFTRDDLVEKANRVLAEYYGAVLPDGVPPDVTEADIKAKSTAICKDLSFYPTPPAVVERILNDVYFGPESRVLEPSAGDGAIVRECLNRRAGTVHAVEVDPGRVAQLRCICRTISQRLIVDHSNFLSMPPVPMYTHVVMNPPFYGIHYMQHVMHAFDFLKPGGTLVAVLPITAELGETKQHKAFQEWVVKHSSEKRRSFYDLPLESFAASGTRISTVYIKLYR